MSLHTIIAKSEKVIGDNSPLILTAVGAAGVLTTAFLTGKASIRASKLIEEDPYLFPRDAEKNRDKTNGEKFKLVWKEFIPPAAAATVTIGAIVLANRIGNRRLAALAAAYTVSDRALTEYKEKVVEKIGKKKAKEVTEEIAQDKLRGVQTKHLHVPGGEVLMLETYSMRPFTSTMEKVRKVENDLRERLLNPGETVTVSDYLKALGLKGTPYSDDFGWGKQGFKLDYSAGLTDDELPCIVWHFAVDPTYRPVPVDRFQI